MSPTLYILDTSYLLEICGCGRDSNPEARKIVLERLKKATAQGGRFFVPLPCLFELGDHIADVRNNDLRERLAIWLKSTVTGCLVNSKPWIITPTEKPSDVLPQLLEAYVPLTIERKVGLVDVFAAEEAKRLKARFKDIKSRVHIWTNDQQLKLLEPDKEVDPYLWKSEGSSR
jgi:hypothetical protein